MSDPQIIRNDAPHAVSVPDGSHVAMSKSAVQGEPSIRKVLADPDAPVIEHVMRDNKVVLPPGSEAERSDAQLKSNARPEKSPAPQTTVQAEESHPLVATELREMDFPARLIHLKIENDKVRSRLDQLEQQMKPGA